MAKVTITISDGDEVQVDAEFDPPANNGVDEDTQAQIVAKAVLVTLAETLGGHDIYSEHG